MATTTSNDREQANVTPTIGGGHPATPQYLPPTAGGGNRPIPTTASVTGDTPVPKQYVNHTGNN